MFGSKGAMGLDIGSHSVKVCQLTPNGSGYELERFGFAEIFPDGEIADDPAVRNQAVIDAIKRAFTEGGFKSKRVVSAVSGESIIVRYLQLPEMPEEELKKALQWEAEEYIPFRLSEVNIDSMVLGRSAEGGGKMDVLLVSAKKDLVEEHLSLIRAAGLEPRLVDLDAFAFLNCFELSHQPGAEDCVALLNIGNLNTNINIYHNKASRFSRDIPMGGETMTQAIKSHLGCARREAERYKINQGVGVANDAGEEAGPAGFSQALGESIRGAVENMTGDEEGPEAVASKAIQNVLGNMLMEVRRSIEFFENQNRGVQVKRLVVGGGTAQMQNLVSGFEHDLQLEVELIDPLRRVQIAKSADASLVQSIQGSLGVVIGLGLRGAAI